MSKKNSCKHSIYSSEEGYCSKKSSFYFFFMALSCRSESWWSRLPLSILQLFSFDHMSVPVIRKPRKWKEGDTLAWRAVIWESWLIQNAPIQRPTRILVVGNSCDIDQTVSVVKNWKSRKTTKIWLDVVSCLSVIYLAQSHDLKNMRIQGKRQLGNKLVI